MGLKGEPADSLGDIGGSASVFNAPVHAIEFKHTLLSDKISDNPMMMPYDDAHGWGLIAIIVMCPFSGP